MARKKGSRNKVKEVEPAVEPVTQPEEQPEIIVTPEEKPEIKDDTGPVEPEYVSTDEAARILRVNEACARLWFNHGHLTGIDELGFIRISRQSLFSDKILELLGKSKR